MLLIFHQLCSGLTSKARRVVIVGIVKVLYEVLWHNRGQLQGLVEDWDVADFICVVQRKEKVERRGAGVSGNAEWCEHGGGEQNGHEGQYRGMNEKKNIRGLDFSNLTWAVLQHDEVGLLDITSTDWLTWNLLFRRHSWMVLGEKKKRKWESGDGFVGMDEHCLEGGPDQFVEFLESGW